MTNSEAIISTLLTAPDPLSFLQSEGLLTPDSMIDLVNQAKIHAQTNPTEAQTVLNIILNTDFVETHPAANYTLAQTYAMQGDFATAEPLIHAARDGYLAQNRPLDAWRTIVGLLMVLTENGKHQNAIDSATTALTALKSIPESNMITAMLLQNRGLCFEQMGRYANADADYGRAESVYQSLDLSKRQAELLENRGLLALSLGKADSAISFLQDAEQINSEPTPFERGRMQGNLGYAYAQVGRYGDALMALETAFSAYQSSGFPAYADVKRLDSAEMHLTLNLLPEAITRYEQLNLEMPFHRARALWGWGIATRDADKLAESAQIFESIGNAPLHAQVLLAQAELTQKASLAQNALTLADNAPLQTDLAHLWLANFYLETDQLTSAHQSLNAIQTDFLPLRIRTATLHGRLAQAHGDLAEAQFQYETAINGTEALRTTLHQESYRTSFFSDKTDPYAYLVTLLLDQNKLTEGFVVAEQARSRTLVELMLSEANDSKDADPATVALRERLNLLYNQLLGGEEQRGRFRKINADAVALEHQLMTHLTIEPQSIDHFATALDQFADETIVAYYGCGDELVAFVHDQEMAVVRNLGSVREVAKLVEQLRVQWSRLAHYKLLSPHHLSQLTKTAQARLQSLYETVFAPIERLISSENVVIVPFGSLHRVPFHALFDGSDYLIDRLTLSVAPSVSVYGMVAHRETKNECVTVFGISDMGLNMVTKELASIQEAFPHAETYVDEQATIQQFQQKSSETDWLHIACHGIFRQDNPAFSALKFSDGWLSAQTIANNRLPDSLVLLSACESGKTTALGGDETIGLPRAFLAAGARGCVATLWLVDDGISAEFMHTLYQNCQKDSLVNALRKTQIAIRDRYPHPFFWSPHVLIGKRS